MSAQIAKKPKADSHLISFKGEENGILTVIIDGINVSYINAIRRTILSDIPTLVFNCFPHDKNDADIHINTSRLNNEILKQRLIVYSNTYFGFGSSIQGVDSGNRYEK